MDCQFYAYVDQISTLVCQVQDPDQQNFFLSLVRTNAKNFRDWVSVVATHPGFLDVLSLNLDEYE